MFHVQKIISNKSSIASYSLSLYTTHKGFLNVAPVLMLFLFNSFTL